MIRVTLSIFIAILSLSSLAQSKGKAHDLRRQADKQYDRQAYTEAEESYRRSTIIDPDEKGTFNLGNAIFNQNRYDEAARQYEKAAEMLSDKKQQAKAWYNLGNAHYLNGKYDQSVQAFKKALRADPDDLQAKQNLLMALRELEMQQQRPQPQEQNDQEDQDQEQSPQENQQPENNPQQPQPQDQSNDQDQSEPMEQKLTKEQAMQLLEIIEEEDKKVQEKLRKAQPGEKKKAKDW